MATVIDGNCGHQCAQQGLYDRHTLPGPTTVTLAYSPGRGITPPGAIHTVVGCTAQLRAATACRYRHRRGVPPPLRSRAYRSKDSLRLRKPLDDPHVHRRHHDRTRCVRNGRAGSCRKSTKNTSTHRRRRWGRSTLVVSIHRSPIRMDYERSPSSTWWTRSKTRKQRWPELDNETATEKALDG